MIRLKPLTAWEELSVPEEVAKLLPLLLAKSLSIYDANAIAHNTVFLFFSLVEKKRYKEPLDILKSLSLADIADLCRQDDFDEHSISSSYGGLA